MASTLAEQLVEVRTAISAVLSGAQSATLDGMSVTRGDLAVLFAREKSLEAEAVRATKGRTRRVCEF